MYQAVSIGGALILISMAASCATAPVYDVIVRGGSVYDGSGGPAARADVGIRGDRIETIGDLSRAKAATDIDASGLAVAPGFINMLSWATESLIHDPRSQSDIRQGVTLEVMGEGDSMGPLNPAMKKLNTELQGDIKYDISWTTLGEYLGISSRRKVSQPTSRRLSGRQRSASTSSGTPTVHRRPKSWVGCEPSFARRWRKGRSALAPPLSTLRRFTPGLKN